MTFTTIFRSPHSHSLPTFDGVRRVHYARAAVFRIATARGDVFLYESGDYQGAPIAP